MLNSNESDNTGGYADDFAANVAEDIGASLFSKAEENPEVKSSAETVEPLLTEPVQPAEQKPVLGQNSQIKPLPKSWKRDMAPEWEKLPPAVHDYVYAREADVMRGIQQYQAGSQQWTNLIQPFEPLLAQHPNVNPVQLMQGLMNTHLQLLDPGISPVQKAQVAQKILRDYGIDLSGAAQNQPPETSALMQEIQSLRGTVTQLQSGFQRRQEQETQNGIAEQTQKIEAFAADPKNEYFNELGNDILQFIQKGVATDLASAYEMAAWSNPVVRAKILAKQQASAASVNPRNARNANGTFVNLESSDPSATRRSKPGNIESTIDSVVASHFSKH